MKRLAAWVTIFLALGVCWLRADNGPLNTDALATLAVQDHGRKKPFTTFAHEMLLSLSGQASLTVDHPDGSKTRLSPEEVILDLWFKPEGWDDRPLIMINFLELKQKLGVPEDRKLFSFNELMKQPPLMDMLEEAQKEREAGKAETMPAFLKEAEALGQRMQLFRDLVQGQKETIMPNILAADGKWSNIQDNIPGTDIWSGSANAIVDTRPADYANGLQEKFTAWYHSYSSGDISQFNALTPQIVDSLRSTAPQFYPSASSLRFEHTYMVVDPFLWAWIIYFAALLVLLLTAIWARQAGYLAGWALVIVGLGFEVYGFAARIIISGRPPVTDLYETVIWVSFIGMVFAVILEAIYRKRFFLYAGLPAAILTLIVADSDSTILDASINPLTAVLRNNMWLTIHVLSIVSSYAAFLLTAVLGHIALVMTFWGKRYAKAQAEVYYYIYRAMQIGILLIATGTILGGVWAYYSWGRFWGWDPKETWALITLLCYLALLHGRLAGWWKGFGLAVGSVVCFLSVMMSWYGVNFILGQNGKSLHSYGLSTGGLGYATGFAAFELLFVATVIWWQWRFAPVKSARESASETGAPHAEAPQASL
jgi:ABC-type transport system involved in cytochrome c biogenesis permease subunit